MIGRKIYEIKSVFVLFADFVRRYGISPGGIASQSYSGMIFFDMDW